MQSSAPIALLRNRFHDIIEAATGGRYRYDSAIEHSLAIHQEHLIATFHAEHTHGMQGFLFG
jgi:hypothetical protein